MRLLMIAAFVVVSSPAALPARSAMDTIAFTVTVNDPAARTAFERGMVALHSFAYADAHDEFRAAIAAEPNFAMAHWGEAMAFNRPVWNEQDTEGGRAAIARLDKVPLPPKLTPRERALIETVHLIYKGDDKAARDRAYHEAMERLYRATPDDDEITVLTALAAMGEGRSLAAAGGNDLALRMRAAALALEVFQRTPDHPGAAHYAIHALDDPEHAILALPAARHYAKAAPDAYHALHMPSHIFVQLGMWPEARAANEAAWASSLAWAARKTPPSGARDTHSLSWLGFVQLQEGRKAAAAATLEALRKTTDVTPPIAVRLWYYAQLAGSTMVETGDWKQAAALFKPLEQVVPAVKEPAGPTDSETCCHKGGSPGAKAATPPPVDYIFNATGWRAYFLGLAAVESKHPADAAAALHALEVLAASKDIGDIEARKMVAVQRLQVAAAIEAGRAGAAGLAKARAQLTEAAAYEAQIPISGPVFGVPTRELEGEILLGARQPAEARVAFAAALERYPNRPRALLGLARAAKQAGDRAAAREACQKLAAIWGSADAGWPGLAEVKSCAAR
jgi:Tfp pilus assembly protein PilF